MLNHAKEVAVEILRQRKVGVVGERDRLTVGCGGEGDGFEPGLVVRNAPVLTNETPSLGAIQGMRQGLWALPVIIDDQLVIPGAAIEQATDVSQGPGCEGKCIGDDPAKEMFDTGEALRVERSLVQSLYNPVIRLVSPD